MNAEIIGCSDRGTYSATLSPAVINALNKWNEQNGTTEESGSNDSNNSPSTDTNMNCSCTNQEKPPYFHPPYVV